jgi:hypothetical protein
MAMISGSLKRTIVPRRSRLVNTGKTLATDVKKPAQGRLFFKLEAITSG